MQRGDIPLTVWTWSGPHIIIVWGEHALKALTRIAQEQCETAATNYRIYGEYFRILVFQKKKGGGDDRLGSLCFGGPMPILCYNVLSSLLPSPTIISALLTRYALLKMRPTLWVLNPHVPYPSTQQGIVIHCVKESDKDSHALLSRQLGFTNDDEMAERIARETHTLPVEVMPNFMEDEQDELFFFN